MRGHDFAINSMSPVGELGGLHQTAWIAAEGERLANENESEIMAQRLVDRSAVQRSFEPDAFYDSLASLTSFREQGGFADADADMVLNDQFPATQEATGTFPPMGSAATRGAGSQAPSFPQQSAPRTVSRAVDARFADAAAPPAASSGLVLDQGTFAAPTPPARSQQPRAAARWASDPPPPAPPAPPAAPSGPGGLSTPATGESAIQRLADRESSPQPQPGEPDSRDEPAPAAGAPRAVVEPSRPNDAAPELTLPEPSPGPAAAVSGSEASLQRHASSIAEAAPQPAATASPPPSTPAIPPGGATVSQAGPPPITAEQDTTVRRTAHGEARARPEDVSSAARPEAAPRTVPDAPTVPATPGGVASSLGSAMDLNIPVAGQTGTAEQALQRSPERSGAGESTQAPEGVSPPPPAAAGAAPSPIQPPTGTAAATPASDVQRLVEPPPVSAATAPGPVRPGDPAIQDSPPGGPPGKPVQRVPVDAAAPVGLAPDMPLVPPAPGDSAQGSHGAPDVGRATPQRLASAPSEAINPPVQREPAAGAPATAPATPSAPWSGAAPLPTQATQPPSIPPSPPVTADVQRRADDDGAPTATGKGGEIARAVVEPASTPTGPRDLDLPLAESGGTRGEPDSPVSGLQRTHDREVSDAPIVPPRASEPGTPASAPAVPTGAGVDEPVARAGGTSDATLMSVPTPAATSPPIAHAEATPGGAIARTPDLDLATERAAPDGGREPAAEPAAARRVEAAEAPSLPIAGATPDAAIARTVAPVTAEPHGVPGAPVETELALHTPAAPGQPGFAPGDAPTDTASPVQRTVLQAEASAPPAPERTSAELTLNEAAPAQASRESAPGTATASSTQPGGSRVDRSPEAAAPPGHPETVLAAGRAVPGTPTAVPPTVANPPETANPPVQRAAAQAGAPPEMPELGLAVAQHAEAGGGTWSAEEVGAASGTAGPPVQRAVAHAGASAELQDLDLAVPQQAQPGGGEPARADTVMRAAETVAEPARPEPARVSPGPGGPTAMPAAAMDLVQPAGGQQELSGRAPVRRSVEPGTVRGGTTPATPVPPVAARPGPAGLERPLTMPGVLDLNTPIARSVEAGPDGLAYFEPVPALPGGGIAAPGPTLELATALPGPAGGERATPGGSLAETSIGRAIDGETAPLSRPAAVQPHAGPERVPLEQPLFAAATSPQFAAAAEQIMRTYSGASPPPESNSWPLSSGGAAPAGLEFVGRTVSAPMEAFGTITSVQREPTQSSETVSETPAKGFSPEEFKDLSEKVWQYVRREMRLERDRQRGRP
ncbi:MAG: hypothetical protein C0506_13205 [Anaerolinea sp.]|nr:hypothetical protein [Anaerolinea sp.]